MSNWRHSIAAAAVLMTSAGWGSALAVSSFDGGLTALQRELGLRLVDSPHGAPDVQLRRVAGDAVALSDSGGDWMLLTFWATWCGPCALEMPSLERLHRSFADRGLRVVAVSIDRHPEKVAAFIAERGLTLPILLDDRGTAAKLYGAQSVPMSFLIDPSGLVRGVSRGARDWTRASAAFAELLAADFEGRGEAYAAQDQRFELPAQLVPPTATYSLLNRQPRVGEPFYLDVRVEWRGTLDEYLLHPPALQLPDGVVQDSVSASSNSVDGNAVLDYRIALRASDSGTFALDPIEVRYTPLLEGETMSDQLQGPTVAVAAPSGARTMWTVAGSAAALALAGLAFVWWRRSDGRRLSEGGDGRREEVAARLLEARRQRMRGDGARCLQELVAAARILELDLDEDLERAVGDWVERSRYGGEAPPRHLVDRLQRQIERQSTGLRQQADEKEMEDLGLDSSPERI